MSNNYPLTIDRLQNHSSDRIFDWAGQSFHAAQPRLSAFLLGQSSRLPKGQVNHRLLSALLNGPILQASARIEEVFLDMGLLATTADELRAARDDFLPPDVPAEPFSTASSLDPYTLVQQMLGLRKDMASLDDDDPLKALAAASLLGLQEQHKALTLRLPGVRTVGVRPRDSSGRYVSEHVSEHHVPFAVSADSRSWSEQVSDILGSAFVFAILPPVPYLGGWTTHMVFQF